MTMPINLYGHSVGTVPFWRSAAPHYNCRSWKEAMRRFAIQHGKAIAIMANDDCRFVERDDSAKAGVVVHHLSAANVRWHKGY